MKPVNLVHNSQPQAYPDDQSGTYKQSPLFYLCVFRNSGLLNPKS